MDKDLIEVFRKAVTNEVESQEFYELAAGQISAPEVKEGLLRLAAEEKRHQEFLLSELKRLHGQSPRDLDESEIVLPDPNIYIPESIDLAALDSSATVFSIGMRLEKESRDYYLSNKHRLGGDLRLEVLFEKLAQWESQHYDYFKMLYDHCNSDRTH